MRFLKYIFCALLFVTASVAETININWLNDGATYAQTTCEIGGDVILPTPPTKRGYTFKGWQRMYTQLEYIESTGTQYIDTGVFPDNYTGVLIETSVPTTTNERHMVGCRSDAIRFGVDTTANGEGIFGFNSYINPQTGWEISPNTKFIARLNYLNDRKAKVNEGAEYNLPTIASGLPISALLFARRYNNNINCAECKIYSCKLSKNTEIVHNFIPAKRNSDSVIGMYDTVSGQFFTNAGTGEFIAGPVVENQSFDE